MKLGATAAARTCVLGLKSPTATGTIHQCLGSTCPRLKSPPAVGTNAHARLRPKRKILRTHERGLVPRFFCIPCVWMSTGTLQKLNNNGTNESLPWRWRPPVEHAKSRAGIAWNGELSPRCFVGHSKSYKYRCTICLGSLLQARCIFELPARLNMSTTTVFMKHVCASTALIERIAFVVLRKSCIGRWLTCSFCTRRSKESTSSPARRLCPMLVFPFTGMVNQRLKCSRDTAKANIPLNGRLATLKASRDNLNRLGREEEAQKVRSTTTAASYHQQEAFLCSESEKGGAPLLSHHNYCCMVVDDGRKTLPINSNRTFQAAPAQTGKYKIRITGPF